jgi:hypothetical protein
MRWLWIVEAFKFVNLPDSQVIPAISSPDRTRQKIKIAMANEAIPIPEHFAARLRAYAVER